MSAIRNRWRKVRDTYPWQECARVFAERGWVYGWEHAYVPDERKLKSTADFLFNGCSGHLTSDTDTIKSTSSGRMLVYVDRGQPVILTEALDREAYFEKQASDGNSFMCERRDGTVADGGGHD